MVSMTKASSASSTSVSATSSSSAMPSSCESRRVSSRSPSSGSPPPPRGGASPGAPTRGGQGGGAGPPLLLPSAPECELLAPGGGSRRAKARPPRLLEMARRKGGPLSRRGRDRCPEISRRLGGASASMSMSAPMPALAGTASRLARSPPPRWDDVRPGSRISPSTNMKPKCDNPGLAALHSITMSATFETTTTSTPSAALRRPNSSRKSPTLHPKGTHCTTDGSKARAAPLCHSRQRRP
mmetsp:Transcript_2153/g.6029  ORF Transcript_2153/g.6029 Transcript_2153/m.6029 type:complete len:240 (-) Transcript_2153:251-970(-)